MNFARFVHPGHRYAETMDSSLDDNVDGFRLMNSLKINDTIPFALYKSVRTGLTVCFANVEDPIVSCKFAVATEVLNDVGLPNAVAHLVLSGSENYPYTEILSRWSHRCYSLGAQICTFQDYTCYSIKSSVSEGFFSLLPIYLDHLLYPAFMESAFITNIHHISKYGENEGRLYHSVKYKEKDGEYVTYIELMKAMYPENCGYNSIVEGTSEGIAEYLVLDEIIDYHIEYYRPENLTVLIIGQINHVEVFQALRPIEEKIISKGKRSEFKRPWQTPVKPFTKSIDVEFQYPSYSCTGAYIRIAWQGPSVVHKLYEYFAFCVISQYFTDTTDGAFQKVFNKQQIFYEYYFYEFSTSALSLMFPNVPGNKVPLIKESVMEVLKHTFKVGIKFKKIKTIIRRYIINILNNLENNLHETIASGLFKYILYGKTSKDLDYRLNIIYYLKKLENESKCYWSILHKKYFVDTPMIVIKGTPSEMSTIFSEVETERKIDRIYEFGILGLTRNDIMFSNAMDENSRLPVEVLESLPVPGLDSIDFHHIKSYSTETSEQHPDLDVKSSLLPFFTYLEHASTNFVYMFVVMDTTSINKEYKKYIPLLLELIMESPVKRLDQLIPYKKVIKELKADTVVATTRISLYDPLGFSYNSSDVYLMLQLEYEKYEKGVKWIKELLYDTVLTVDRLREVATRKINDIAQLKTKGETFADNLMKILLYNKDSNPFIFSLLHQEEFLTDIIKCLNDSVSQKEIMANIESSRKALTLSKNIVLYMTVNVTKLTKKVSNVYASWETFFSDVAVKEKTKLKITADMTLLTPTDHVVISNCIMGLENKTNAFFLQTCPCINDCRDPDLPALLVYLMYLNHINGSLSITIRCGCAYDYEFFVSLHEGLLYFAIYDATDLIGAYTEAKKITENHMTGEWLENFYESAKSFAIFLLITMKNAVGNRANETLRCCRGLPLNYYLPLIRHIPAVTKDDLTRVAIRYIKPLFDPEACKTVVVCDKSEISALNDDFRKIHRNLIRFNAYSSFKKAYSILSEKM